MDDVRTQDAAIAEQATSQETIPEPMAPAPGTPEPAAAADLDQLDDIAELDDIEFILEEVESKIAPLALAAL